MSIFGVPRSFGYVAIGVAAATFGGLAFSDAQVEFARTQLSKVYVATNGPTGVRGLRPDSYIGGSKMHIKSPFGIAIDKATRELVVANRGTYHGHSRGSLVRIPLQRGDQTPSNIIQCQNFDFSGVTFDHQGNIVAGDVAGNSVMTFARDVNGCSAPLATLGGNGTGIQTPVGVAIDSQGRTVVLNFNAGIEIFPAGAEGNVGPLASISGTQTGLAGSEGLAVDRHDNLYAAVYASGSIVEFAAGSNGNVSPIRTIAGPDTMLRNPIGIAVDRGGNIYVADYGRGALLEFGANASGDAPPRQVVRLTEPSAVALPQ